MNIGENIKRYRAALGLTQEALANTVGVTAQAVSKWETGDSMPDGALFIPIADALGVSLDRLCGHEAVHEADAYNAIIKLIRGVGREVEFEKIREICWQTQKALFGIEAFKMGTDYKPGELNDVNNSSAVSTDNGFTFISNRPELPFYSLFPEPEGGYGKILHYNEAYGAIFAALGDEFTLKTLFALYAKPLSYVFDAQALARECAIPGDRLEKVLDNLIRLKTVGSTEIDINGTPRTIYRVMQRYEWVAVLAMVNEIEYHCKNYNLQADHRSKSYL